VVNYSVPKVCRDLGICYVYAFYLVILVS
jgi:hypothetical protein